jgi:hypothetical protein
MTSETFYNITQAANASGKSNPTIRKYLRDGRLPNAKETTKGGVKSFSIPLTDLVAAGLMDKVSSPVDTETNTASELRTLAERLGRLELEIELKNELLADYKERLAEHKEFLRAYVASIETRQVQDTRRSWFNKKPKLKDRPEWDSSTD